MESASGERPFSKVIWPLTKDRSCFLPETPLVWKVHWWTLPRAVFFPKSQVLCSFFRGFEDTTSLSKVPNLSLQNSSTQ